MKQILKKVLFYLFIALLFYACAEEKEFVNSDRNQNFDFKEKSFKEALALPVFNNAYQKVSKWKDAKKNKSASKTALEDEFGFTIVEEAPVRIITDENGTIFYTILIERELKEELKFENLLIKVQNDTTTAAIFKYTLTEKGTATEDNHYPIKDISDVEYTDLNLEGKYFYNSNGDFCNEINVIRCSAADDKRPAGHIATQECWDHFNNTGAGGGNYSNIYSSTQITCVNGNIGGGGSTPTGSGNGGTSSNNTGGLGASGGNSNPPPPITAPIPCKTGNCIQDSAPTPCETLKIAYSEIPQFYNTTLENALSDDREHGFVGSINFNSTTNQTVKNFALAPNVRRKKNKIAWWISSNRYAIDHTHTENAGHYFTPSANDIHSLYIIRKNFDVPGLSYTDDLFFVSMTVNIYKYAIKIDNYEILKSKFEGLNSTGVEKLNDKFFFYLRNIDNTDQNRLSAEFLKFFEGYGVSLYRRPLDNTNSPDWVKLKLKSNNIEIEEQPCNN